VVSNEEACCGHDMLWNGRFDLFEKLAARNLDLIRQSGAKRVVFSCPEGYYTFLHHYPQYFGELGFEVIHFYDLVEQMLADGALKLQNGGGVTTYHDPCRLGRMAGIYESPRKILERLPKELISQEFDEITINIEEKDTHMDLEQPIATVDRTPWDNISWGWQKKKERSSAIKPGLFPWM